MSEVVIDSSDCRVSRDYVYVDSAVVLKALGIDTFEGALKYAQGLARDNRMEHLLGVPIREARAVDILDDGRIVKEFRDGEYRQDNDMPGAKPMSVTFGALDPTDLGCSCYEQETQG